MTLRSQNVNSILLNSACLKNSLDLLLSNFIMHRQISLPHASGLFKNSQMNAFGFANEHLSSKLLGGKKNPENLLILNC